MAGMKIKDDGSIVANGMSYKDKAAYKAREKTKKTGSIFEGRLSKNKKAAANAAKANTDATKKMYAAESMFKSAKNRDDARVMPGKARPFGVAFKSAKDAGKSSFSWKGKSYTTQTKSELEAGSKMGKFKNRFDQTGKDEPKKKESIFSKFKSSKTGSELFKKLKEKK
jgi:hypothetical protein